MQGLAHGERSAHATAGERVSRHGNCRDAAHDSGSGRVLNRGVMPSMPVWQRQWQRQWWNRRRPIRCPRRLWA